MAGNFFYLGTFGTSASGTSLPLGDGTIVSATLTTIQFPSSAKTIADFYKGMVVAISSGIGQGQARLISAYSTAQVATVSPQFTEVPSTTSLMVVGIPMDGRDGLAVKVECVGTANPGAMRAEFWAARYLPVPVAANMARVFSTQFTNGIVLGATSGFTSTAGSLAFHCETRVIDALDPRMTLAKIYCETSPTANTEMFAAATFTSGRAR